MAGEGVLATLQHGWHAPAAVDAPKAVIGGLALTAWKHARYTRDADVLVAIDRQRVGEVVVRPDDLLVIKLLAGRIIDRADAAMILRENRHDIDFDRLHRAVVDHGLVAGYREIWSEAFPDEPPPLVS